jgi:hypothetical protein
MLHVTHTLFIAVQYVLVAHDLFTVTVLYSMQSRVCTVPGYPVLCTTVPFLLFSSLQAASCKLQAASCKLQAKAASCKRMCPGVHKSPDAATASISLEGDLDLFEAGLNGDPCSSKVIL